MGLQNLTYPRLKACLVARSIEQWYGIDFEETFVPVIKWSTIRAITARVAQLRHEIHHLDVKIGSLFGLIKELVFI
jgi:hypothetical protein